jgi:phospholipase C
MRAGQRYVYNAFKAFATSPLWKQGVFLLTYDEWGGFFDHVRPPVLPDDRSSAKDQENFGQAGFRVPSLMASPFAREGFMDHRVYDHTSILRFIEWRFLGAPAEGAGGRGRWYLTKRDRNALNIGRSLRSTGTKPDVALEDLAQLPVASGPCTGAEMAAEGERSPFERDFLAGYFERVGYRIDLRPLPYATDD